MTSLIAEEIGDNNKNGMTNTLSPGIINNAEKAQVNKTRSDSYNNSSPPVGTITPSKYKYMKSGKTYIAKTSGYDHFHSK